MRPANIRFAKWFLGASVLCSVSAHAEVWSGETTITSLYPTSTGYIFTTAYANTNLSTCDNGRRWSISSSFSNYNAMVATLIAAFTSGSRITLNIDELPPSCEGHVNRFIVLP